jgi:hypothetical protein
VVRESRTASAVPPGFLKGQSVLGKDLSREIGLELCETFPLVPYPHGKGNPLLGHRQSCPPIT